MINLLIIDDDQDLLTLLSSYFLAKGMRVLIANNYAEGVKQSERKRIDVTITDFQLGDGTGADMLTHFHAVHPETRSIMISGFNDPGVEEEAKERGASAFLRKPLDLELLENWVRKLGEG